MADRASDTANFLPACGPNEKEREGGVRTLAVRRGQWQVILFAGTRIGCMSKEPVR